MITPIHKKGSLANPENYRGISLLSCLGKFFTALLNKRLSKFVKDNNILSENQLGFVSGNRTSDAHIILQNLIKKNCYNEKSKIYSCFIDFSKAFDKIPRNLLFEKLIQYKINGNFFNVIKSIYSNDQACIKIGNKVTEKFELSRGVRQGCILSPLLFNIFLADLSSKLNNIKNGIKIGMKSLSCLLWADDVILFSKTPSGLSEMLKTMESYSDINKLTLNTEKTKCMIFNKAGRLIRDKFYYKDNELENVKSYKYLGFIVTPSGEITSGLKDLRDRALKSFMKIKHAMGSLFNRDIATTLKLFDCMIKPVLLYASDFWGCFKLPIDNPIEKLHYMFCKHLLGVQKQTSNIGTLLELGRVPMKLFAVKAAIKNWERIKIKCVSPILSSSYTEALKEKLPWIINIKTTLEKNGMLNFFIKQHKTIFVNKNIFQTLSDNFHQDAFRTINDGGSKLRTYALLKSDIGVEKYLKLISNTVTRKCLTQFRLSNHTLNIEIGRRNKLPREQRLCKLCPNSIESEIHFLLSCPTYDHIRSNLLKNAREKNAIFKFSTETEKFKFLMSDAMVKQTAEVIQKCFLVRAFLLKKPKVLI